MCDNEEFDGLTSSELIEKYEQLIDEEAKRNEAFFAKLDLFYKQFESEEFLNQLTPDDRVQLNQVLSYIGNSLKGMATEKEKESIKNNDFILEIAKILDEKFGLK